MTDQPSNTTQLAAMIRRDIPRTGAWANLTDSEINQLAGLVAHHGVRVAACPDMWPEEGGHGKRHRRQKRRILQGRVRADTPTTGFGIGGTILMGVISWMVQRFLDWIFLSDSNRTTAVSIGSALPAWGTVDMAAIAGVPLDDDTDPPEGE